MRICGSKFTKCWLAPVCLLSLPTLGFAQADIDVGGSEADDGAYGQPYPDQDGYGQYGNDYNDDYASDDDYDSGTDDGLPIVYAGDGMQVRIDQIDDSGTYASGTLTLGNEPPMKFEAQILMGPNEDMSVGQVQTPSGLRPFRAQDQSDEVTVAEFEGRRYRLVYQDTSTYGANDPSYNDDYGSEQRRRPSPQGNDGNNALNNNSLNNNKARREAPLPVPKPSPNSASPKTVELVVHKLGRTHTLLAPKGWKVEGGAWQPPVQAYNWMPSRHITVTGPDGSSVRFKPHLSAVDQRLTAVQPAQPGSLNQASGLINMRMPGNGSDWARWIEQDSIRSVYTGATSIRVSDAQMEPALTENLRRLYAPMTQFMQSMQAADYSMRPEQTALTAESHYNADGKRWQQIDAFNHIALIGQVASAFGGADYYITRSGPARLR